MTELPSTTRFFEDFAPGETIPLGTRAMSAEEIVAFATQWDPQPFHLDEAAGRASLLGGLAASGWHTACAAMRLLVDGLLCRSASLGAPGIERLVWLAPVVAGDHIAAALTVVDTRTSQSRPTLGFLKVRIDVERLAGERPAARVATMETTLMMSRRVAA